MKSWITKITASILLLVTTCAIYAQTSSEISSAPKHYVSHSIADNRLIIQTNLGEITLSALTQSAFSVNYKALDNRIHASELASYAIKENHDLTPITVTKKNNSLVADAGALSAKITLKPFSISYYRGDKQLISEKVGFFSGEVIEETEHEQKTTHLRSPIHGVNFEIDEQEQFLGGGQRVIGMNRRGHRLPLYNRAHYGYETHSTQMNYSLPAVMSDKHYMVVFDNAAKGWLDIAKSTKNTLQFEAVAGSNRYLIVAGDNTTNLIENYVDITGKQPMPPRWAFGNFASRFGYRTQQEVLDTAARFRDLEIPLDAIILDLYWFGKDIKGHMGNLAWDYNAFPTPQKMLTQLNNDNIKPILITEPFILSSSHRFQEAVEQNVLAKDINGNAKTFDFYFGNTGIVDVFNKTGRDWFNNIYRDLEKQGVKGWWGDLGEPEVHPSDTLHTLDSGAIVSADAIHNAYGHQWAKMVFDNLVELNPTERPFILMRSGFAGSQRYGMIPWTGDVNRTWGGLQPQVELSLQMGLFGLAYTHSDLGGFAGGEHFNKELYIRWLQYGVFQPIFRPHGQEHIPSEVVFHDQETQDILRKFIQLRYQLLPYNYTLAFQNSTSGMPLMRPTFFDDATTLNNTQSYLWGDAFFVHPITKAGLTQVSVDLPSGVWFDYWNGTKYQGGQTITVNTALNTIPVFVKAGAFIPSVDTINSTAHYSGDKIKLSYYADESMTQSAGQMYDDDGETRNAINDSAYRLFEFSSTHTKKTLDLHISSTGGGYKKEPNKRIFAININHLLDKPAQVLVNGKQISNYDWQTSNRTLVINVQWQQQPINVKVIKHD